MITTVGVRRVGGAALLLLAGLVTLLVPAGHAGATPAMPRLAVDCPPPASSTTLGTLPGGSTTTAKPGSTTIVPHSTTTGAGPTTTKPATTTTRRPPTTNTTQRPTTTTRRTTTTLKPTTTTRPRIVGGPERDPTLIAHVRPADPCPPPETTTTTAPGPGLHLYPPSVPPGGHLDITGHGCPAGADVSVAVGDHPVGAATADDSGDFSAPVDVPPLAPGRYDVVADCGPVLTTPLDVVLATSVGQGGTALALLGFFLLLAGLLLRRGLF